MRAYEAKKEGSAFVHDYKAAAGRVIISIIGRGGEGVDVQRINEEEEAPFGHLSSGRI